MTLLLEMKTCEVEEEERGNGEIDAQETLVCTVLVCVYLTGLAVSLLAEW